MHRSLVALALVALAMPFAAAWHGGACPTDLTGAPSGYDAIRLDWDAAPGAVAHNVYRALGDDRLVGIGGVLAPQTDYLDEGLAKGHYRYSITGYDELHGESPSCAVIRVSLPTMP